MPAFRSKISEDDLTQTVLYNWSQFHPRRLTGNPMDDEAAARKIARQTLTQARILAEYLQYSPELAMSEAMREYALQ